MTDKSIKSEKIFTNTVIVIVCALLCNGLWGSAFPCVKLGCDWFGVIKTGDKLLFAGMRFAIAGVMVIIFNSVLNKKFIAPKTLIDAKRTVCLCAFQTVLQYLFFYIGLTNTSGVKSSIIVGSNVFVAIIIATIIPIKISTDNGTKMTKEELTPRIFLGCMLGFIGIVVVNITSEGFGSGFAFNGEGFLFLSTIAYGLSTLLIKKYSVKSDTVMLSGWQFFVGGIILMTIGVVSGGNIQPIGVKSYIMLVYLALVSAVAYTLWGVLLKYNSISKIAIFGFTNPVFGVILSALLLDEGKILNYKYILALIFVCMGICLVNIKRKE